MDSSERRASFNRQSSLSAAQQSSVMRQNVSLEKSEPDKRYMFRWMPAYCHNDLVEGSWWFVWGSLWSAVIALITLIDVRTAA